MLPRPWTAAAAIALAALLLPGQAVAQDARIDPNSPSGVEYDIPFERAKRELSSKGRSDGSDSGKDGSDGGSSSEGDALFGEGIEKRGKGGGSSDDGSGGGDGDGEIGSAVASGGGGGPDGDGGSGGPGVLILLLAVLGGGGAVAYLMRRGDTLPLPAGAEAFRRRLARLAPERMQRRPAEKGAETASFDLPKAGDASYFRFIKRAGRLRPPTKGEDSA